MASFLSQPRPQAVPDHLPKDIPEDPPGQKLKVPKQKLSEKLPKLISKHRSKLSSASLTDLKNLMRTTNTPRNQMGRTLPVFKRYKKEEQLGEGVGGDVYLVKSLKDSNLFAIKSFRTRDPCESVRDYQKKIGAEYTIGSVLRHPNVIKTVELSYEGPKIYQVLEYCEYDLYAIVMSAKMQKPEIYCCFKQILKGVNYLHHTGVAHRDLKLDNCVINKNGIVKIIDFGAASIFNYPHSNKIIKAIGIVGSEPYLAPEEVMQIDYDPRPVDIWSLGIIFICMIVRRFPWSSARLSDDNFKRFIERPAGGESLKAALKRSKNSKIKGPVATNEFIINTPQEELLGFNFPCTCVPINQPQIQIQPESSDYDQCCNDSLCYEPNEESNTVYIYDQYCTEPMSEGMINYPYESFDASNSISISENDNDNEIFSKDNKSTLSNARSSTTSASSCNSKTCINNNNNNTINNQSNSQSPSEEYFGKETNSELRVLDALPKDSWKLIRGCLQLAPCDRFTIDELLEDEWIRTIETCHEYQDIKNGNILRFENCKNHTHTIVDSEKAHIAGLNRLHESEVKNGKKEIYKILKKK